MQTTENGFANLLACPFDVQGDPRLVVLTRDPRQFPGTVAGQSDAMIATKDVNIHLLHSAAIALHDDVRLIGPGGLEGAQSAVRSTEAQGSDEVRPVSGPTPQWRPAARSGEAPRRKRQTTLSISNPVPTNGNQLHTTTVPSKSGLALTAPAPAAPAPAGTTPPTHPDRHRPGESSEPAGCGLRWTAEPADAL